METHGASLPSWNDTATKTAIMRFVETVTQQDGPGYVRPEERVAVFDNDGTLWCEKPVRIWSRIGRRPILARGNANGDIEMLQFAGGPTKPARRLLLLHDDAAREFDYIAGAEKALDRAISQEWTVVSLKNDWTTVL